MSWFLAKRLLSLLITLFFATLVIFAVLEIIPGDPARLSDLAPGDHRRFVCVETANAGDEVVTLAPGDVATLTCVITSFDADPPAPTYL